MWPIIFHSSFFTLYSYPLLLGIALGISYLITQYLFAYYAISDRFVRIWWPSILLAWAGAKLLFVLTYRGPHAGRELLVASSFWFGGGFVFLGGLLGALLYFFIGIRLGWFKFREVRLLVPGIALGHAVGRVGCFLAGCCYGGEYHGVGAVYMHHAYRYPVQLIEAFFLLVLGGVLLKVALKRKSGHSLLKIYLISYAVMRFILEFMRGDTVRGLWWGISTSQIISLLILIWCAVDFGKNILLTIRK